MPGPKKNDVKNIMSALPIMAIVVGLVYLASSGGTEHSSKKVETQTVAAVEDIVPEQKGDLAMSGGTPTIRKAFVRQMDDPATTNDESNDQPVGHFGTTTLEVHSVESGNTYTLDAEISGGEVERIYFPKGGWVDLVESDIDATGNGSGTDEKGRHWEFEGFGSNVVSMETDEEKEEAEEVEE